MVICTYFLNNTCRFGTKCHNEHVNVKLTLKTDAECTLKGNQWPLSCYGPFREKPCVPNFIDDQTFEEARHLCYEAKATGNVQMAMNQFAQSVLDAKNKMNMLTNPTDDVVRLVTNLYNSTCTSAPTSNANVNPNPNVNPFGMGEMNSTPSAIFGGANGGGNPTNNANLFGSAASATSTNPFVRNTSAFGMSQQNQTTNLFGNASTANTINPFSAATNTASNTLFGGSSFSNTGNSAFGSSAGQTASLFGGHSAVGGPFSQPTIGASPFAQTNQTTTVFGGAQTQSNAVFGGGAAFGNQVKTTGLFGQANAALGQSSNVGTIFGQSVQNSGFGAPAPAPAPTQTNFFGSAAQTPNQTIFGGQQTLQTQDNPFAAVAQSATTNIFGNAQTQLQPAQQPPPPAFPSSTNMFGGSANAFGNSNQPNFGGGSAFQAQPTNQMGDTVQTTAQQPLNLQQQQQSIFGTSSFSTPAPLAPNQGPFAGGNVLQNQQQPQQPSAHGVFSGGASAAVQTQQNPFYAQQQQQSGAQQQISKTLYTPMDMLTPDEIEAFNAASFDINKLPTNPPPMELCI